MAQAHVELADYFEEVRQLNVRKRKYPVSLTPRRQDIRTCDLTIDLNRNSQPRFKLNICCKKLKCTAKFTPEDVLVLRKALLSRPSHSVDCRAFVSRRYTPRPEQKARGSGQYFCDSPEVCRFDVYAKDKKPLPLQPVDTVKVCAAFFCWAYCVSRDMTRNDLQNRIETRRRRRLSGSPKEWEIESWVLELSRYYQIQPDSALVLLPFANKQSVYEMYTLEKAKNTPVHCSYFFKIWRTSQKVKHIRLRKHLRFAKCDICVDLRERKSCTMDKKKLAEIRNEEYLHYHFVKSERGGYYYRQQKAINNPQKYLSMIIDGADWYNYAVPYFATKTHTSSKIFRVPLYLIGVLVHGRGSKCYVVPGHFKQGTNVVLDVLIRQLKAMKSRNEHIPTTLCLQLDNTCKQNKNKYLVGMLAYLVQRGVFKKVLVSFLPKGHTHEDIDQLFSRLVTALMSRDARSVAELMTIIEHSYKDKQGRHTETEKLSSVANLSEWLEPYLNDFEGITKFRQIVIKWRGKTNKKVVLRVRKDTIHGEWRGIEEKTDYTVVFKMDPPR